MMPQNLLTAVDKILRHHATDQFSSECFLGQVCSILLHCTHAHVSYVSGGRIQCTVTLFCLVAQLFAEC